MADWEEAQVRLDNLRASSRSTASKEVIFEDALETIHWMSEEGNRHLDMFGLIRQAATIGLTARHRKTGEDVQHPPEPENEKDIPWPPSS